MSPSRSVSKYSKHSYPIYTHQGKREKKTYVLLKISTEITFQASKYPLNLHFVIVVILSAEFYNNPWD